MAVLITGIENNSISMQNGLLKGDKLVSINGEEINDMLDLQFYSANKNLTICIIRDDKEQTVNISKDDEYQPLGLEFETYLIDKHHSCKNKCIFCFVDQLPKGLRPSLYFKDDDERLSFLFGNYITLTNLSKHEIDRIKKMKISPINISVHSVDPEKRVFMMKNPSAANINVLMDEFAQAGITMNCQVVLCKGANDEEYLKQTIQRMQQLYPSVQSLSIVPLGVTRYREKLAEVETFNKEESLKVINQVNQWTQEFYEKTGNRIAYLADEFYLRAGVEVPEDAHYGDYSQLENGVGMVRYFINGFEDELEYSALNGQTINADIAVGMAMYPVMKELIEKTKQTLGEGFNVTVHGVENNFFGGNVWVTGLLTATDIIAQLKDKLTSDKLYLCEDMLRAEKDLFLDDKTPQDIENALNVTTYFYKNDGASLVAKLFGTDF